MTTLIVIGDILICAFLATMAAWLFIKQDDADIDKAARLPLTEDDE